MKKIVFLFLFFLCSFCYGASTRLSLQSYYTTDSTLEIQDIPDSAFSDDNRVNSFVKDGYCWVQAYIPVEALKNKVHVLKFSDELFNFVTLLQDEVHNTAIEYHRKLRQNKIRKT